MGHRDIVVIGGSAGSLQVLQTILPALPWDFPAAVFVVLHTSEDSPGLLPEILNRGSKLPVMYAVHGADILPARVYIAPAGQRHMLLDRGRVRLEPGPPGESQPAFDRCTVPLRVVCLRKPGDWGGAQWKSGRWIGKRTRYQESRRYGDRSRSRRGARALNAGKRDRGDCP